MNGHVQLTRVQVCVITMSHSSCTTKGDKGSLHMDLPCCPPRAFPKKHLVAIRNPISITLPRNEQSAREFLSKSKTWRLKITGSKKSSVCPRGPLRQRLLMRFPAAKMWPFFSEGLFTTSIKSKLKQMFWNLV